MTRCATGARTTRAWRTGPPGWKPERDAQARVAVAAERARIARELHDVIAHNVSVMVVQADGASYALGTDPVRAKEALAAISATGRQALAEMRRLLGVLRREEDGDRLRARPAARHRRARRAPRPGARIAGLPVSFTVEGVPQPLPGGVALAAYRIVQESLTNTRKHAGPVASRRRSCCATPPDAVVLTISDDGRGAWRHALPGAPGHGLTGMRERVAVYGGSVTRARGPAAASRWWPRCRSRPVRAGAA